MTAATPYCTDHGHEWGHLPGGSPLLCSACGLVPGEGLLPEPYASRNPGYSVLMAPLPLQELTEEQGIIAAVLFDRARESSWHGAPRGPGTVAEIAQDTAWPGARTYGVARTRRILHELRREGIARRLNYGRAGGVHWALEEGPPHPTRQARGAR